jgi:hypothetical protein
MLEELANLNRFDEDFQNDPHVYVPRVHEDYCAPATLTLENVDYIKINDIDALKAWGISRRQVADRLYDVYMKQIFITNFIHVDPHPGNLFVRPLPLEDEAASGIHGFSPGDRPVACEARPFQIVFIDFGMTAVIPQRFKAALRTMAIGVGTRDARKVVQAYVTAGVLQPGVDTMRLEAAHEDWFNRLWGIRMGKIHEVAFDEARYFLKEYRDLITEIPFQLQEEMLFIGRAVGILAGMATQLDPEFDPWGENHSLCEEICPGGTEAELERSAGGNRAAGAAPVENSCRPRSGARQGQAWQPGHPGLPLPGNAQGHQTNRSVGQTLLLDGAVRRTAGLGGQPLYRPPYPPGRRIHEPFRPGFFVGVEKSVRIEDRLQ